MLTSLFPENNEKLIVKQGKYGNCFLLVAFECIYKSEQGRQFLESMFEKKNDEITVKLAHTTQSVYLQPEAFHNKYGYFFDEKTCKDVFTVRSPTLTEIDKSAEGVRSNALSLKILERLIPHYFQFNWDRTKLCGSLEAYDSPEYLLPNTTSSSFLSKILGITIDDSLEIEHVIKLKHLYPNQPVYSSMKRDSVGSNRRSRHAFLLDSIVPMKDDSERDTFVFINPWNNQKPERYSKAEVSANKGRFVIYVTDPEFHKWFKHILNTPQLVDLTCEAKRLCPSLIDHKFMKKFSSLHSEITYLPDLISGLASDERRAMYYHICRINESKEALVSWLLFKCPYVWLGEIVVRNKEYCTPSVSRNLASIALREKSHKIYNYLIEQQFDFGVFISLRVDKINGFLKAIVTLESHTTNGNLKLARINRYIEEMNAHKIKCNSKFRIFKSVIECATENALHRLKTTQSELLISDVLAKIDGFYFSFHQWRSRKAATTHQINLFNQLDMLVNSPEWKETSRLLGFKKDKQHPSVVASIATKKAAINKEIEHLLTKKFSTKIASYPEPFFREESPAPSATLNLFPSNKRANLS